MNKAIKAVLFDLDDTLYPEKQFVLSGFKAVSEYISKKYRLQENEIFTTLKEDFENGLRKKNFNVLLKKLGLKDENVEDLIKVYREHSPDISLYHDAESILNSFKGRFKMGLITDGHTITQKNKILSLGIKNYFDIVIINDVFEGNSKKDRQSFLKALFQLEVGPENTLYVGDNPLKDFARAKEIGIHTVRVKRKTGEYNESVTDKSLEAHYVISSLLKLPKIIEGINRRTR